MSILSDELTNDPNSVGYSAMTDEQVANSLNAKVIASKRPIPVHDIQQYLMLVDLLLPIEAGSSDACQVATRALALFDQFDISNPMIEAKLTNILDGLVADTLIPGFTATNKAAVLAMGDTTISRADELGITVTTGLAQAERN